MELKKLIVYILIPVILGSLIGIVVDTNIYKEIVKPLFSPPSYVFPIVWTILFILMGLSSYLIRYSYNSNYKDALNVYWLQLFFNLMWSIIFFSLKFYLVSFVWILILIGLVIYMIVKFYKIDKLSAYLQIPYLIWLFFAAYLNLGVYILN